MGEPELKFQYIVEDPQTPPLKHHSKMMWSFKEQRYVPADEYWEIDGDCRLVIPHLAHCPSEVESLYPDAFAGHNDEDLTPSVVLAEHSTDTPFHTCHPGAD